jgi:hypothetical protein
MFNNNRGDDAPVAAARMRELLGQAPGTLPERAGGSAQLSLQHPLGAEANRSSVWSDR